MLTSPERVLDPLDLHRVLDPSGAVVGDLPSMDPAVLTRIHRTMRLVRRLDERMLNLQRQGRVGFYGACTGQEAGPIATAAALRPTDWIFPALREGAAMLYRGYPLDRYLGQVFGNAADATQGRQMPSHQADRSVRHVSWSSCIGTQLPQAVGAARAVAASGGDHVVVAFMGDGATSTGDFHAAMYAAASEPVPCVLICQNNHWSISVPTAGQTRARSFADRAAGYGLATARVDGNDPFAVFAAVGEAADRARRGAGAVFLELLTYRVGAHSSSDDPRVYRDEAEVELWRERDPIVRLERYLRPRQGWSPRLEAEIEAEIELAIQTAEAQPRPLPPTLFDDVVSTKSA